MNPMHYLCPWPCPRGMPCGMSSMSRASVILLTRGFYKLNKIFLIYKTLRYAATRGSRAATTKPKHRGANIPSAAFGNVWLSKGDPAGA